MSKFSRYEEIVDRATEVDPKWSAGNLLSFHAFNSNGLVARKYRNDATISDLVAAGTVPAGFSVAYGTFAEFEVTSLMDLVRKTRKERIATIVAVEMLSSACEQQEAKIAEAQA